MKVHFIEGAPKAVGPYSHAVEHGNTLYVSGQLGLDPVTNKLKEGVIHQAEQALENLNTIITGSGFEKKGILKCTVYLKDINNFQSVNEVYETFMEGHKPARVAFEVAKLPLDALVEIDAIVGK